MKTELEDRTLEFAVRIAGLVDALPKSTAGWELGRQLLKAGTSIGANYREAQRGESRADFIHKIAIAEKEAAETEYWLLVCERVFPPTTGLAALLDEARQLLAILVTIGRNAKKRS